MNNRDKEKLEKICKEKYLMLEKEPDYPLRGDSIIHFRCLFHKGKVQTNSWVQFQRNVGCNLCKYPMSRLECIIYLGCKNAIHKYKIDKTEFSIYLPEENTAITCYKVIGFMNFNVMKSMDTKKKKVAQKAGIKLISICETKEEFLTCDENELIIPNFISLSTMNNIGNLLEKHIPSFQWSEDLWDKASIYMREYAKEEYEKSNNSDKLIKAYGNNGTVEKEYCNFDGIAEHIYNNVILSYINYYYWEYNGKKIEKEELIKIIQNKIKEIKD